jgi:hypothetical protein
MLSLLSAVNPTHAMLYSAFIPGGGQVYNKAYVKAGIVIGVQGYLLGSTLYNDAKVQDYKKKITATDDAFLLQHYRDRRDEYREARTSDIWWMGITCVLSMLDAYVDAHLHDFEAEKGKLHLRFEDEHLQLKYHF